ncbi:sodium-dependent transporter [Caenispirillum salinarum]|nr:sodium-dependent transporter [Caenispirillum salinarum]
MTEKADKQRSPQAETAEVERVTADTHRSERPEWTSERAFILSTAAAGVGLGNLWRFPYILGDNGGGAFLVAYLIAMVCVGVPFAALEIAAGRLAHGSSVTTYARISRLAGIYGWGVVLLTLVINSYYFVVTGWTAAYAGHSLAGGAPDFSTFTQGYGSLWFLLAVTAGVGVVLAAGLAGIERFTKVLVPILVATVLGLAVYGLSNGTAGETVSFLFRPDMGHLGRLDIWAAAFGQAFYSLTIGQGYLITYGSYLPRGVRVVRSVGAIAGINVMVALLAGLMIFPLVFRFDLDPAAGSDLAFKVLPQAFDQMSAGAWVAPLFFGLFFFAAFSSCIAGAKVVVAALSDRWGLGNRSAVGLGMAAIAVLGVPSALSYAAPGWQVRGQPVLDAVDSIAGSGVVVVSGLVGAALLAWTLSGKRWATVMERTPPKVSRAAVTIGRWAPLPVGLLLAASWATG